MLEKALSLPSVDLQFWPLFVIQGLVIPSLRPGQVVIMDNATFHKSPQTRKLIEQAGYHLLFLPPYSPDLNPLETFWANLKNKINEIIPTVTKLSQAIDKAFNVFHIQT